MSRAADEDSFSRSEEEVPNWLHRQAAPLLRLLDSLSTRTKQLLVALAIVLVSIVVIVTGVSIRDHVLYGAILLAARSLVLAPPPAVVVLGIVLVYATLFYVSKTVALLVQPLYCAAVVGFIAHRTVRYYYPADTNGTGAAHLAGRTRRD